MKIKLIRNTIVQGEEHLIGEILENVPESESRYLIGIKKAIAFGEQTEEVETADMQAPNMETTVRKRVKVSKAEASGE